MLLKSAVQSGFGGWVFVVFSCRVFWIFPVYPPGFVDYLCEPCVCCFGAVRMMSTRHGSALVSPSSGRLRRLQTTTGSPSSPTSGHSESSWRKSSHSAAFLTQVTRTCSCVSVDFNNINKQISVYCLQVVTSEVLVIFAACLGCHIASSALTLLVRCQEGHPACKNWVLGCWCGYLSGTRCRLAYGPADATATHCLLLQ